MKKSIIYAIIFVIAAAINLQAQEKITMLNPNIFFGGNFGLQFGSITQINLSPTVGYRFPNQISAGVGLTYDYYNDSRYQFSTSAYGASIFGRYNINKYLFAHVELENLNMAQLDISTNPITNISTISESDRYWITSFFVGGGYRQLIGERSSAYIMVLWNLNQSTKSPYSNPIIKIGFDI